MAELNALMWPAESNIFSSAVTLEHLVQNIMFSIDRRTNISSSSPKACYTVE